MSHPARLLAAVLLGLLALGAITTPARGQARESFTVDESAVVFQEVATIPEAGIPVALLQDAHGFAIIPSVIRAGFIVGGRFGRGVVVVRDPRTGGWSNPIFITVAGGGVGFQAGASATDLILVFRSRKSVESFLRGRGQFTLGADAGVAAGPVGRQLAAGTDVTLRAEILSYSRSRGLFAGISLEGASLKIDWQANVNYYGEVLPTSVILAQPDLPAPASAARLKAVVTQLTTPVVVVPAEPGAVLEAFPADGLTPRPLPPASEAPPTTRLQSAESPSDGRVVATSPDTGERRVVYATPMRLSDGRIVYALPPGTVVAGSTPRQAASAGGGSTGVVIRSTPSRPTRSANGWKNSDGGSTVRR